MNTENIKKKFEIATQSHKVGEFKNAEKFYKKVLDINPNHFESAHLLGTLSAQIKNFNQAKEFLERAIKIKSDYSVTHYNLGNVFVELENIQEAIKCFEKAIQLNPKNADSHNNLGNLLKKLSKIQDAENCYKKAIQLNPGYTNAYNNLGTIFQKNKNFSEAIKYYEKAIKIDPNFASPHNNLGLIFYETGEYQKSINSFSKALKIKSDYAEAFSSLGKVYKELGDFEKSKLCFKKAIKYKSNDLLSLHYLSELDKDTLTMNLESQIAKTIQNKNCTKINLAYGNYLLSNYELKRKNYKKEFSFLIKGHQYYFDSQKERFLNGMTYWFNISSQFKKLFNFNEVNIKDSNNEIKPIFIIGVPRSGSTLVEKIIASGDSYIPIGEETHIFHSFIENIIKKNQSQITDIDIIRMMIVEKYKKKGLVNKINNYTFTDKSLENIFYIKLIIKIFPGAKFVYCKRNSFSSIVSIIKNNLTEIPWAHNLNNIFKYFDIYFNEFKYFKENFPNPVYELEYEKLVKDPEKESKELLKFCDLPWNESCLKFYKREDLISKTASNVQIRRPIYKDSINKYVAYKDFFKLFEKQYSWFNFS